MRDTATREARTAGQARYFSPLWGHSLVAGQPSNLLDFSLSGLYSHQPANHHEIKFPKCPTKLISYGINCPFSLMILPRKNCDFPWVFARPASPHLNQQGLRQRSHLRQQVGLNLCLWRHAMAPTRCRWPACEVPTNCAQQEAIANITINCG